LGTYAPLRFESIADFFPLKTWEQNNGGVTHGSIMEMCSPEAHTGG